MNLSEIFEQNSRMLREKDGNAQFVNTIIKAESLFIKSSSKDLESLSPEAISQNSNMIHFNTNVINEIPKNEVYLNTDTPQKIERFKSLDAFPFTKNNLGKYNIDSSSKPNENKTKSIYVSNERKLDFFNNVGHNRVNDLRKYNNLVLNINNCNYKASKMGNSLNEKSQIKKSFEKKNLSDNNQNIQTKRNAFLKQNKEILKKI